MHNIILIYYLRNLEHAINYNYYYIIIVRLRFSGIEKRKYLRGTITIAVNDDWAVELQRGGNVINHIILAVARAL